MHAWAIEPRELDRQETRRGRRHAYPRIDPARSALVVIDMIPFFVDANPYCCAILPNIAQAVETLRRAGSHVVWIVPAPAHRHPALAAEFYGPEIAELYRAAAGEGPPQSRLWPGFTVDPTDAVLEKTGYSAFFPGASALPAHLAARGIDTVLLAGTVTNICVESSARDAFASGHRVILLADACAARRDADHNAALHNIYRSFGDVRATADLPGLISPAAPMA